MFFSCVYAILDFLPVSFSPPFVFYARSDGSVFNIETLLEKDCFICGYPLLLSAASYIKNYIIFDTFSVSLSDFAVAFKTNTFEFMFKEDMLAAIQAGTLRPIDLCYAHYFPITYQGVTYSYESCNGKDGLLEKDSQDKAKAMLAKHPNLAIPLVLKADNNFYGDSYIPNTIQGLIFGKELRADSARFIYAYPKKYMKNVLNSFNQLFRSVNTYVYIITGNGRNFPSWYASTYFDLDFFKIVSPAKYGSAVVDQYYRPWFVLGILGALVYALLFAANVKNFNRKFLLYFTGMIVILESMVVGKPSPIIPYSYLLTPYGYLSIALIWSHLFIIPSFLLAVVRNIIKPVILDVASIQRIILIFLASVCLYDLWLVVVQKGSAIIFQ